MTVAVAPPEIPSVASAVPLIATMRGDYNFSAVVTVEEVDVNPSVEIVQMGISDRECVGGGDCVQ